MRISMPRRKMLAVMWGCVVATGLCGATFESFASPRSSMPPPQSRKPVAPPPASSPSTQPDTQPATEKLIIAGEEFQLEIAATPEARENGLMNRDKIEGHGGMIFIYPHPQTMSFWMKNCPIEMDILFVNTKGSIVAAHRMKPAPPVKPGQSETEYDDELPRYESRRPAQFAIELKAGTIERLKIKPGDKIELEAERVTGLTNEVVGK